MLQTANARIQRGGMFPDPTWKITDTLGSHGNTGIDPLHPSIEAMRSPL